MLLLICKCEIWKLKIFHYKLKHFMKILQVLSLFIILLFVQSVNFNMSSWAWGKFQKSGNGFNILYKHLFSSSTQKKTFADKIVTCNEKKFNKENPKQKSYKNWIVKLTLNIFERRKTIFDILFILFVKFMKMLINKFFKFLFIFKNVLYICINILTAWWIKPNYFSILVLIYILIFILNPILFNAIHFESNII